LTSDEHHFSDLLLQFRASVDTHLA